MVGVTINGLTCNVTVLNYLDAMYSEVLKFGAGEL